VPDWPVLLLRDAERYLSRLPADGRTRIVDALDAIARDPLRGKPLHGEARRSLRVGGWRILYRVDEGAHRCVVTAIGPRGDVYKD
jgi:mRNA-degrading endonuclease RelE of RelBE toxin-antitoxin system